MSLYGVAGDRAAVVIDASLLPDSSFTVPFGRTGVIRAGLGSNAIEWLTIAGHPFAAAAIETDLVQTDPQGIPMRTAIRVAHVVAGGRLLPDGSATRVEISGASARGVDIRNVGTAGMAGRGIDAEIVNSEVFGGVEGIRIINFNGAHFGEITVTMQGNRSYANRLGCIRREQPLEFREDLRPVEWRSVRGQRPGLSNRRSAGGGGGCCELKYHDVRGTWDALH